MASDTLAFPPKFVAFFLYELFKRNIPKSIKTIYFPDFLVSKDSEKRLINYNQRNASHNTQIFVCRHPNQNMNT